MGSVHDFRKGGGEKIFLTLLIKSLTVKGGKKKKERGRFSIRARKKGGGKGCLSAVSETFVTLIKKVRPYSLRQEKKEEKRQ